MFSGIMKLPFFKAQTNIIQLLHLVIKIKMEADEM